MAGKGVCLSSAPKRLRVYLDTQYILKILAMTYDLLYNLTIVDMIHPHNSTFQKKTYKIWEDLLMMPVYLIVMQTSRVQQVMEILWK